MYAHFFKRLLDVLLSLIALPFAVLVIIIMTPVIWLNDHGPIFYNAPRIGRNGKTFKMFKLRSMFVDSPDIRFEDGNTYNGEDDPRVTKVGKFLRKTSIDEIPQLFNVLNGTMSLIGPRPDTVDYLEKYPEDIKIFLSVRPGITGYSQAYFRNGADGGEKMQHDAFYARNCTFCMDARIFFKTIVVVIKQENIYREAAVEAKADKEAEALEKQQDTVI